MIMGPAKMMDHASVMLDFSAMTVPVNSQRPVIFEACIYCWCFARFPEYSTIIIENVSTKVSKKTITYAIKFSLYYLQIILDYFLH